MSRATTLAAAAVVALGAGATVVAAEQLSRRLVTTFAHPAIDYEKAPSTDLVADLNARIAAGTARLTFDDTTGYLRSVLDALHVPVQSQMLVTSKTGIQALYTSPANPRAIFFNDAVTVGYIRGAPLLELAVQDPRQGVIFYTVEQKPQPAARLERRSNCLTCHNVATALYVPGMLFRSAFTRPDSPALGGADEMDDRMAFADRWGGWYVSGTSGDMPHLGKDPAGAFDNSAYLAPHSDIVALLVFGHQARMMNLITRVGWDVRVAIAEHRLDFASGALKDGVEEFVDAMLFVDEAPLTAPVAGTSGFAEIFAAEGPRDHTGRSLRQLDLRERLLRYPCSYMIYSAAFRALPVELRDAVFRRAWDVLSGNDSRPRYARLSATDRKAVMEILRETVLDLPAEWAGSAP